MKLNWEKYGINAPFGSTTGQKKVFCPQCRDIRTNKRDRSLSINLATGEFHCHYCGFSGSVAEKESWEMENSNWKNYAPIRKSKPEYKRPVPRHTQPFSQKALAWFNGRGISEATLIKCRVTEGEEWMPQKEAKANTVQFNYYLNGELINTKFRTGDKCFKMVSGAELIPYNIDAIKGKKTCVITEGEMDCLSFVECGINECISVPNGANANLDYLDAFIDDYFNDKETIYIASDTDTKGVLLRDELIHRFGADRCRVLEYGEGCKDANEHLQAFGKDSLLKCIDNAPEIKIEGIFSVGDFEQSLDALFENGLQKGYTIGHPNFDNLCSFETKRLCIVTGIPGSGKSEFIDEIAERLNIRYGWRFAYFSPENQPLAYHASKLIEKFTGKKFNKKYLTYGEYKEAKEHLENNFFFISPSKDFQLGTILEKAKSLVRKKGIKALVIDPYNRLESKQGNRSETQYISEVLDTLTTFAQINDVLVILMAHPTKQHKNADGIIEAPTLYDISGSANFFNKADFGIVVHRNNQEDNVVVKILKVKFKHLGECGDARFRYNINNGRYAPLTDGLDVEWDNSNHLEVKRLKQENISEQTSIFNTTDDDAALEDARLDFLQDNDSDVEDLPF